MKLKNNMKKQKKEEFNFVKLNNKRRVRPFHVIKITETRISLSMYIMDEIKKVFGNKKLTFDVLFDSNKGAIALDIKDSFKGQYKHIRQINTSKILREWPECVGYYKHFEIKGNKVLFGKYFEKKYKDVTYSDWLI